jgi:outer membrane protein OmpA-like peptidoglycan-associated protein
MYSKLLFLALAALLPGCFLRAPPAPQLADETTRRPVNAPGQVDLQACQANLANARLALEEAVHSKTCSGASKAAGGAAAPVAGDPDSAGANTVFVIPFDFGSDEVRISKEDVERLIAQAWIAAAVQVRGRTDAVRESAFDDDLAQKRAQAVASLLASNGVDPARIRQTFQGHGDPIAPGEDDASRARNRRVEVEIYRAAPRVRYFTAMGAR